jgi:DNA-binding transcriptional MerR regulator
MPEEPAYTIGELADLAGVTPRTIRYYTAEGLLPKPDARGQYALYGAEHLLRLRLIARLKEAYLPLGEIKARIEHLDAAQLRALLDAPEVAPAAEAPASAADYVAQVLSRQAPPQILAESAARYSAPQPPETPGFQVPTAMLPGGNPPPRPPAAPAPSAPPYGFAAAAPAPAPEAAEPLAASAGLPRAGGLLRKLVSRGRPGASTSSLPEDRWRRVTLAPGVELHINEPATTTEQTRIERLLAFARELFRNDER